MSILTLLLVNCQNVGLHDPRTRGFGPQLTFSGETAYPACDLESESTYSVIQLLALLHVCSSIMLGFGFVVDRAPILTRKTHMR